MMQDPSDSIYYKGPSQFRPEMGSTFRTYGPENPPQETAPDGQASQELLNRVLEWANGLIDFHTKRTAEFQVELSDFSLVVHNEAQEDALLRKAQEAVWKTILKLDEETPDYINYWQFMALENVPSYAAQTVRENWVRGIRDFTGTMAYDLTILSKSVLQESQFIKSFIDKYLGDLDDTSETVILRLYDDWLNTAANLSVSMVELWNSRGLDTSNEITYQERSLLEGKKASDVQELMRSKIMIINQQITQSITQLEKNFIDYADVFYSKYFGPALDYRLRVNRYQMPYNSGILGREAFITAGSLDAHLSVLMADQMRRHQSFSGEIQSAIAGIAMREQYKDYINNLVDLGSAYPVGSPGTMIRASLPVTAHEKLTRIVEQNKKAPQADTVVLPVEPSFSAHHDQLEGRDNPNAHPQYVTKDEFEDLTGIKLTGLDRAKQVTKDNGSNPRGLDVATVATAGAGSEVVRQVAQNGLVSATSKSRPASPAAGQIIYEVDTKAVLYWDGKTWRYVTGGPPDYTFTFMTMGT